MQGNVHEERKGPVSEVSSRGRCGGEGLPGKDSGQPEVVWSRQVSAGSHLAFEALWGVHSVSGYC